jgi:hypothetical protein
MAKPAFLSKSSRAFFCFAHSPDDCTISAKRIDALALSDVAVRL